MKETLSTQTKRKVDMDWVKTPYPNLIHYKPSGSYFGRVRVNGKLIRRSLDTHVLTVAKLKLSDFLQDHRRLAVNKGESVTGEVVIEMFKQEIEDDHNNKPRTKLYKQEVLIALKKAWPGLYSTDIARISQKDCNEWAAPLWQGIQSDALQWCASPCENGRGVYGLSARLSGGRKIISAS